MRTHRDAIRFHLWSYAHFPLSLGIVVVGVGIQRIVSAASHYALSPREWAMLGAAAAAVAAAMQTIGRTAGRNTELATCQPDRLSA